MGRAHDPRSAAIGGSCEDRRVARPARPGGYTVKAAGPDRASQGRAKATALWRAARRRELEDEPDPAARGRADRDPDPGPFHSRIPPGRYAPRRREGGRRRPYPHPEFRGRLHRPREPGPRLLV